MLSCLALSTLLLHVAQAQVDPCEDHCNASGGGLLAHPEDDTCSTFCNCGATGGSTASCPPGLIWNAPLLYCDYPTNYQCPAFSPRSPKPSASPAPSESPPSSPQPLPSPEDSPDPTKCRAPPLPEIARKALKTARRLPGGVPTQDQMDAAVNVDRVKRVFTEDMFEEMFPRANMGKGPKEGSGPYTYKNMLRAVAKWPAFCDDEGSSPRTENEMDDLCKLELATMFAHWAQEVGEHASEADAGVPEWKQGLHHFIEMGCGTDLCTGYRGGTCDPYSWQGTRWPCPETPQAQYYGRGAHQLSYNFNYGPFSEAVFDGDVSVLLAEPDRVVGTGEDGWLAFASAFWFHMTPQSPKPSGHDALVGHWVPNVFDAAAGRTSGFGIQILIINGGRECGGNTEIEMARNRRLYFESITNFFNIPTGPKTDCMNMQEFGETSSAAMPIYWEQDWIQDCKAQLVTYQTSWSIFDNPADPDSAYCACVKTVFAGKESCGFSPLPPRSPLPSFSPEPSPEPSPSPISPTSPSPARSPRPSPDPSIVRAPELSPRAELALYTARRLEGGVPTNEQMEAAENVNRVKRVFSESMFEEMFPRANMGLGPKEGSGPYTYKNMLRAIAKWPAFCNDAGPRPRNGEEMDNLCKHELATMFAHWAQEVGEHASEADAGVPAWKQGLYHFIEMGCGSGLCTGYRGGTCDVWSWQGKRWPCPDTPQAQYYGRGAHQLSYNFNYGPFSEAVFGDVSILLAEPDRVVGTGEDGWLAFASAFWFHMTPQSPKPSGHDALVGWWVPNAEDTRAGRKLGFGIQILIINGGRECGGATEIEMAQNRREYFESITAFFGIETGPNTMCTWMQEFGESSSAAMPIYWEQDWAWLACGCQLVNYQTSWSIFDTPADVEKPYRACVYAKFAGDPNCPHVAGLPLE